MGICPETDHTALSSEIFITSIPSKVDFLELDIAREQYMCILHRRTPLTFTNLYLVVLEVCGLEVLELGYRNCLKAGIEADASLWPS